MMRAKNEVSPILRKVQGLASGWLRIQKLKE